MRGRRNPFVAREGLPFLVLAATATILVVRYWEPWYAIIPAAVFVILFLIFRDPRRHGASVALGIVSPVDGIVIEASELDQGILEAPVHRLLIAVDSWGTYTARSPIEGKIMDIGKRSLWVQTDEGDDVVLTFHGYRFGLPPHSFARYGERLGQGQRCAYLRLTRTAEVQFPIDGTLAVSEGDEVSAGIDMLGSVPVPR